MTEADTNQHPPETGLFSGSTRRLLESDLPTIKPILETWIRQKETGEIIAEEVQEVLEYMRSSIDQQNDRTYFVAEEPDGKVVGVMGTKTPDELMCGFATTNNPTEMVNAYVSVDKRGGKGVGSALVRTLETEARAKGFTEIVLNSGPRYKDTG